MLNKNYIFWSDEELRKNNPDDFNAELENYELLEEFHIRASISKNKLIS